MASCALCARPDVEAINAAIAAGVPTARVARDFDVERTAMRRHRAHVARPQREAPSVVAPRASPVRARLDGPADLFDIIRRSLATAQRICSAAEANGDFIIALQAIRTIGADVVTASKLMGIVLPDVLALVNVQASAPMTYRAGESPLDVLRARLDVIASRPDPGSEERAEVVARVSPELPEIFNAPVQMVSDDERIRRISARFRTITY